MPLRITFARNVSQGATSEAAAFRCKTVPPFQPKKLKKKFEKKLKSEDEKN